MKKKKVCDHLESLQAFLDDGPGGEMSEELRQHLYGPQPCLECRKFYDDYMQFKSLFNAAADIEAPGPGYEGSRRKKTQHFRISLLISAAALAMVFGSFYGFRSYSRARVISADTKIYVEDLLDSSLFEISDFSSTIPEDWFDLSIDDDMLNLGDL